MLCAVCHYEHSPTKHDNNMTKGLWLCDISELKVVFQNTRPEGDYISVHILLICYLNVYITVDLFFSPSVFYVQQVLVHVNGLKS